MALARGGVALARGGMALARGGGIQTHARALTHMLTCACAHFCEVCGAAGLRRDAREFSGTKLEEVLEGRA